MRGRGGGGSGLWGVAGTTAAARCASPPLVTPPSGVGTARWSPFAAGKESARAVGVVWPSTVGAVAPPSFSVSSRSDWWTLASSALSRSTDCTRSSSRTSGASAADEGDGAGVAGERWGGCGMCVSGGRRRSKPAPHQLFFGRSLSCLERGWPIWLRTCTMTDPNGWSRVDGRPLRAGPRSLVPALPSVGAAHP